MSIESHPCYEAKQQRPASQQEWSTHGVVQDSWGTRQ